MKQNFKKGGAVTSKSNFVWNIEVGLQAPNIISKRFFEERFSNLKLKVILN